jgi:hypothetical protein
MNIITEFCGNLNAVICLADAVDVDIEFIPEMTIEFLGEPFRSTMHFSIAISE